MTPPTPIRGVHHRPDIVHAHVERGAAGHAIGHAHAPLVEQDQPAELAEPLAVAAERRQLPVDVEVGERALDVDEVTGRRRRPGTRCDVAAPREGDVGHVRIIAPMCEQYVAVSAEPFRIADLWPFTERLEQFGIARIGWGATWLAPDG